MEDFVIKFMNELEDRFDYDELQKWRQDLFPGGISHEDWAEYCFSSESPF